MDRIICKIQENKRWNMRRRFTYCALLALTLSTSFTPVEDPGENGPKTKKDTVQALVIDNNSQLLNSINTLTGEEIFGLIDSLLDADAIPLHLIKEINDYAESRLLEHDYYVSLTNYYDDSPIPANSVYQSWNTEQIYPYNEQLCLLDSTMILVLEDRENLCNFNMPVEGIVTSNFGWREGRNHNGMDIDLQVWDPVVASFDGMVRIAKYHGGYGRVVVIRHYNGLETLYAHLHRLKVKPGDVVEAGQVIGLGGSSGHSTGSHLHYEMRYKGKPLNPRHLISFKNHALHNDSIVIKKNKWSYSAYPVGTKFHVVQRGDFLYAIAKRYGTTVSHLCQLNDIRRNGILREGHKLKITDTAQR